MIKAFITLLIGAGLGAAAALSLAGSSRGQTPQQPNRPEVSEQCKLDLARQGEELKRLQERLDLASKVSVAPLAAPTEVAELKESEDPSQAETAVSWRVSAIEKFVPLSDQQKERLKTKFNEEREAASAGRESQAESLEDIIGADQAATYRQGVQAAFDRVENEELEKETVWVARKVGLNAEQEARMRDVFSSVEKTIDSEFSDQGHGTSLNPRERVTRMIAENKRRVQLRADALKGVLSNEQYQEYLKLEAQSAASDVEVFHE